MKIFNLLKDFDEGAFIELRGDRLLHLDGAERLLVYESEIITINAKGRRVIIRGRDLTLDYLTDKRVAIKGTIRAVELSEVDNV